MKGWRTLLVACALAVLGVLQAFDWTTIVPQGQSWSGAVMIAIAAVMAGLRVITNTGIFQSK